MKPKIITGILILVGLINFAPVIGVLSAERLQKLYGIGFQDPNLVILMRHRAILLGIVGAFLVYAGFRPALQPLAFVAGFISMLVYIALTLMGGDYNSNIQKVMIADVFASVILLVACILYYWNPRNK